MKSLDKMLFLGHAHNLTLETSPQELYHLNPVVSLVYHPKSHKRYTVLLGISTEI
ncbi:hypothetical protein Q604_UNBC10218G0001 [human gut metagenome]|uniref:Uncharacterized protein n=1 Tax=human gut metagenome TaxID=408170 RepID=W1XYL5_9ZZZZ